MSAMDIPPEGNLAVDVDALAGALWSLSTEGKLPPKSSHGKRRREVGSKRALFVEQETDRGPPTRVSQRIDEAHQVTQQFPPWSAQEEQALVLLYTDGTRWSSRASKGDHFWENAGTYIQGQVHSQYRRTGMLC